MIINHNISALNAWRGLSVTNSSLTKSLEKLSSGLRINRAADDAAGLAISEKMRGQIRGLNQAVRNAQDGISLIQTAEGALNETHSILQRMRELVVQANSETNTDEDLSQIQAEIDALVEEIGGIAKRTEFNTKTLMLGSYADTGSGLAIQIGANTDQNLEITLDDMRASALGTFTASGANVLTMASINVTSFTTSGLDFSAQLDAIDDAIEQVSTQRANMGALQNRLEHTIANLGVAAENLTAAESRIRDVDMAQEMMAFTRNQILVQAGTAMLAQANMAPQAVLKLLG